MKPYSGAILASKNIEALAYLLGIALVFYALSPEKLNLIIQAATVAAPILTALVTRGDRKGYAAQAELEGEQTE